MELLLKLFTPRNFLLLGLLYAAAVSIDRHRAVPRRMYLDWRYPAQRASMVNLEIQKAAEVREARKLRRRYDRVMKHLEQARLDGFQVDALQTKANAMLKLNTRQYREFAVKQLIDLEMRLPRKKVQYIPIYDAEEEFEIPADVKPAAPKKKERR